MKVLVLGGTRFLSKRIGAVAVAAGHDVVCAARGDHGRPPDGARFVRWDRNEPVPAVLASLRPDVVIDVTDTPAFAAQAVKTWPDAHWVFISTLNVYADLSRAGGNAADTPLVKPDQSGDPQAGPKSYGAMKVACENLVRAGTASSLVLRPGLIIGPGDPSGRFAYWPSHAAQAGFDGGELLVPGEPGDPVQFIDVGDLADWAVRSLDSRVQGCFDAVGPSLTKADFVAGLLKGVDSPAEPSYIPSDWLTRHDVAEWAGPRSIPLWTADQQSAGHMARDVTASLEAGLVISPVAQTSRSTMAWLKATPDAPVTGLTRAEERDLIALWKRH